MKPFYRHPFIITSLIFTLGFFAVSTSLLIWFFISAGDFLFALRLEPGRETNLFGSSLSLIWPILVAALVIVLNFILAEYIYLRDQFLSFLLVLSSVIASLLLLIHIGAIISFN